MKLKLFLLALALLVACAPVCPPGTTLGPEGICCEGENGVCSTEDASQTPEPAEAGEPVTPSESTDEQAQEETTEDLQEDLENQLEDDATDINAIAPKEKEPEPQIIDKTVMGSLKSAYENKVNGYKFRYGSRNYNVRGDKLKVELEDPLYLRNVKVGNDTLRMFYYDVVYITGDNAIAYCEGYGGDLQRECQSLEVEDKPVPVKASDFVIKLPHEWLLEYVRMEPISTEVGKYHLQNRAVTYVKFPAYEMYFDPLTGLPLKIVSDKETIVYENIVANTVKAEDMSHKPYSGKV